MNQNERSDKKIFIKEKFFSAFNTLSAFYTKREYFVLIGTVLLWQAILLFSSNGLLIETDSYTHALRLMDFIKSASWEEILYRHDNCPFGQMLHFTRIMDMFLYLTTLPFLPFIELKQAVLFGSFLFNPLMAALSTAAFIWAGKAFFGPISRAFGIFVYFSLNSTASLFFAGRPDHHVLLNLFFILILGCLLHGAKTQKNAYYKTAGIFTGLSIWTSPEGLLACFFIFAGMVSAWLPRYQNIRQIRLFSQFSFISSAICLIVNPPIQGLFYPDNGRLSVLMVMALGLASLSFYAEEVLNKRMCFRSFWGKIFSISFLTFFSIGVMLTLFDAKAIFSSPIPPEIYHIWASSIAELLPAYSGSFFRGVVGMFVYVLIFGVCAFPFVPLRIKKLLLTTGVPLLAFMFLTCISRRFSRPCMVFMIFTLLLSCLARYKRIKIHPYIRVAFKVFLVLFILKTYVYILTASADAQKNIQEKMFVHNEYTPYISHIPGCVLSSSTRGPELAWGTDISVVGTPYHSNAQGIIDAYKILQGKDLISIPRLLKKRKITTILLENPERILSLNTKKIIKPLNIRMKLDYQTFAGKLVLGKFTACYLKKISLPPELEEKYIIYHVDFDACGEEELNM